MQLPSALFCRFVVSMGTDSPCTIIHCNNFVKLWVVLQTKKSFITNCEKTFDFPILYSTVRLVGAKIDVYVNLMWQCGHIICLVHWIMDRRSLTCGMWQKREILMRKPKTRISFTPQRNSRTVIMSHFSVDMQILHQSFILIYSFAVLILYLMAWCTGWWVMCGSLFKYCEE